MSSSAAGNKQRSNPRAMPAASGGNNKIALYLLVIAVIGGFMYFDSQNKPAGVEPIKLRSPTDMAQSMTNSKDLVTQILDDKEKSGENSLQYKTAQEHYLKGFRDYQNGQYSRAIQSFQAALSFYPRHELAMKYQMQASSQLSKLIQFHMNQGMQYRGRNNFRLCKASYQKVMVLVKDSTKSNYIQAKQYFEECSLRISEKGVL